MNARDPSQAARFRMIAAVLGCATCAILNSVSFAQDAPPPTGTAQEEAGGSLAAPSTPDLRELYFGPPIMPPAHIWRAEGPAVKPARQSQDARVKTPRVVTHARAPRARNVQVAAPSPRGTQKRRTVAMYKEAVRTQADAFSDERTIRWRKCIPGIQMPLVCYLSAKDRARITVHAGD
jgi:hypothetical protein